MEGEGWWRGKNAEPGPESWPLIWNVPIAGEGGVEELHDEVLELEPGTRNKGTEAVSLRSVAKPTPTGKVLDTRRPKTNVLHQLHVYSSYITHNHRLVLTFFQHAYYQIHILRWQTTGGSCFDCTITVTVKSNGKKCWNSSHFRIKLLTNCHHLNAIHHVKYYKMIRTCRIYKSCPKTHVYHTDHMHQ